VGQRRIVRSATRPASAGTHRRVGRRRTTITSTFGYIHVTTADSERVQGLAELARHRRHRSHGDLRRGWRRPRVADRRV